MPLGTFLAWSQLVPLLLDHASDLHGACICYGSRTALPARVRRFIDLAVERLTDSKAPVLGHEELSAAHARGIAGS